MSLTTSYLCVQGWGEDNAGVTVGTLTSANGNTTVTNGASIASQNLGDYAILSGTGATLAASVDLEINPDSSTLDGSYTVALIGVRLKPLTRDVVVRCTMTVGSTEYQSAATIYGQEMERDKPVGTEGHELFGSGLSNIVFHDLPASAITSGVEFEFALDNAGNFSSAEMYIGTVFVGLQIPLSVDRPSVSLGFMAMNDKLTTRGGNDISSNGVLKRSVSFQAKQMPLSVLTGIDAGYYNGDYIGANMMRAAIANIGQPMLLSLFPYAVNEQSWSGSPGAAEIVARNLSRRQNFGALYGLLDRQIDINADDSFESGEMLYRARMRFGEIR